VQVTRSGVMRDVPGTCVTFRWRMLSRCGTAGAGGAWNMSARRAKAAVVGSREAEASPCAPLTRLRWFEPTGPPATFVRSRDFRTDDLDFDEKLVLPQRATVANDDNSGRSARSSPKWSATTHGNTPVGFRLRNLQVCLP